MAFLGVLSSNVVAGYVLKSIAFSAIYSLAASSHEFNVTNKAFRLSILLRIDGLLSQEGFYLSNFSLGLRKPHHTKSALDL